MDDVEILRTMVNEHANNQRRDASYAALNCRLMEPSDKVEQATLVFIDRLVCDGVIDARKLLLLAAGYIEPMGWS